jgi:tetratricopeptide (TPR) repeat protein
MINMQITPEEIAELVERAVTTAEDYIKNQKYADAEALLKQTLRVNPECKEALRMLSILLVNGQKGKEAIDYYEKLLLLDPNDFEALNNVALCYASVDDRDKAIERLTKAVILYPDNPAAYTNLAIQLKNQSRFDEAFDMYRLGIEHLPNIPELHYNYGIALAEDFIFEDAIVQYKKAIELKPDFASAHWNLGLIQLLLGNYKEGWEEYEWRFEYAPVFKKFKQRFLGTEWTGQASNNKTILVYNEQGAGDAIHFARYLPALKEKGFKVILEVSSELVDLMSKCKGVDQVVPQRTRKMPTYDYYVSIGSLPRLLGIDKPIWDGPYLEPTGQIDSEAFESYGKAFKIGICWAGNPVHKYDNHRSCFLKHFKPLNNLPNTKLFSLQKDARPRFWAGQGVVDLTEGCEDMGIVDMGDLLINFNYTAAIMRSMDAIVTVDTAIAHIAGAMGLKCYLLLPYMPDWRWGLANKTTEWYPTVQLVRQSKLGDYESRLKKIAYDIRG